MEITLSSVIKLSDIPFELKRLIGQEFSMPNPAYVKAKQRNKPTWGMDKVVNLFSTDGRNYYLGRGLLEKLSALLDKHKYVDGVHYTVVDERMSKYTMDFGDLLFELRSYQEEAVMQLSNSEEGIFEAPPGSGKTFTGMALIQKIKQPTLWLTHTEDLMIQAAKAARKLSNIGKVGLIYNKEKTVGDKLTICSVMTLVKDESLIELFNNYIGLVIVDEAHHVPANTFMEVIFKFKAKYIYGLTATPYRADGLQSLMFATLGPVLCTVTRDELYDANYLIRPKIVPIYTLFKYSQASHVEDGSVDAGGEDFNYQAILTQLYADDARTDLVLMNILELSKNTFNYQIVLINNKEYITKIYNRLLELTKDSAEYVNVKPVIFTSDIKGRNARVELLQDLLDKKFNIVFATQLAKEGLDLPHVNILHLVSPRNGDIWNKEKEFTGTGLEQEVGRIQRPAPGKNENNTIVFDYVDHNTGVFNTQFIRRRAVYKRLGLTVPRKPRLEEDANIADFIKSIKF